MQIINGEIEIHGLDFESYFQGAGVYGTAYEYVVTGTGNSEREAFDDCIEQMAMNGEQYRMQAWYILRALGWYNETNGETAKSGFPIDYGNFLDDASQYPQRISFNKWEMTRERDCKRWYKNAGEVVTMPTNESEVK